MTAVPVVAQPGIADGAGRLRFPPGTQEAASDFACRSGEGGGVVSECLNADWVYRFGQNPNDCEPDSGAYILKTPLPDEDVYAITTYMKTLK